MGPAGRRCSWIWSPKVLSVQWSRSPLELNSIKDVRSSVKMYVKNHYMFRFHLIPLLYFLGAMFGVILSGSQLSMWLNMKSLSSLANTGVPHPRSAQFSTHSVPLPEPHSRLCRSCMGRTPKRSDRVAATWSDSNDFTVQSVEGDGKARILFCEDTHGSHVLSLRCLL